MSCTEFDPACHGCRPAIVDIKTGKPLPATHPTMMAIDRTWDAASYEVQLAFWRVTIKNSRDPHDMKLCDGLIKEMQLCMVSE